MYFDIYCKVLVFSVLCISYHFVSGTITLKHLSTVYVPTGHNPKTLEYDADICEQGAVSAHNPQVSYFYTVGANLLHVIDFSDPANTSIVHYIKVSDNPDDGELSDVETCQDWVAVSFVSAKSPLEGRVIIYHHYDPDENNPMEQIHNIVVGALPDSVKFTSDCSKLLVAIEGELVNNNGAVVDPEGGVTVIEFSGGIPGNGEPEVTFVDFTSFNNRSDDYIKTGVRKIYNGQNTDDIDSTTFSQDLEPENLALNSDETLAYIPLQENNAIAVMDIATKQFLEIYPMGLMDYSSGDERLDPSDRDNIVQIKNWGDGIHGLFSFYQADGMKYLSFEGKSYLITANEGDTKDYDDDDGLDQGWTEGLRGKDIVDDGYISTNVSSDFKDLLRDDSKLGRLYFSIVDELDGEGKVQKFITFGGRSIAAFRVTDFSKAWDSGADIEQRIYENFPDVFNGNAGDEKEMPKESMDSRSDDLGPQPESLEYGVVNGKTVIFVGIERPGLIMIYSVVPGSDIELQFESIHYNGGLNDTWYNLWEQKKSWDIDPEDLRFLPAQRSSSGNDMLIVTGAVSGTVSFYDVVDTETMAPETTTASGFRPNRSYCLITLIYMLLTCIGK